VADPWTSEADHAYALRAPELRPYIEETIPLLEGMPEQIAIRPVGGKWLEPESRTRRRPLMVSTTMRCSAQSSRGTLRLHGKRARPLERLAKRDDDCPGPTPAAAICIDHRAE
jgi:hypothetical protein